jgi:hypothetical protein
LDEDAQLALRQHLHERFYVSSSSRDESADDATDMRDADGDRGRDGSDDDDAIVSEGVASAVRARAITAPDTRPADPPPPPRATDADADALSPADGESRAPAAADAPESAELSESAQRLVAIGPRISPVQMFEAAQP